MNKLYTIGFSKKSAEKFFSILEENRIILLLDIRLNNTSQLSGFSKFPDIKFFLKKISNIEYIHDVNFAPKEITLKKYKKQLINWEEYKKEFISTMKERNIEKYIKKYKNYENICLLCSEEEASKCHRSLVASIFQKYFINLEIINL